MSVGHGLDRIGVVVIGRNEGNRLRRCLESLLPQTTKIVYVDSGSTDNSVAMSRDLGCEVVNLDVTIPFTAGRARNAGFRLLLNRHPELEYVQFIDGDCTLDSTWLATAQAKLDSDPQLAIVCGRRREQQPEASLYNALCDMEWNTPVGEAGACGGDFVARVEAFQQVNGFDESFAAGEEPEMCFRMRQRGWKIWRIGADMTAHDAAMSRFGQWWKRNVRSGSAYAQSAWTHGSSAERYNVRESISIWLWAFVIPAIALLLLPFSGGLSLLILAAYPYLAWRIYRWRRTFGDNAKRSAQYAVLTIVGKFAQLSGQAQFFARRESRLIEYKGAEPQPLRKGVNCDDKATIAYIAQFFPILTETFVYREVNALREKGFEVVTLANRTPEIGKLSEESISLMDETEYVFPMKWVGMIIAHLYFILTQPIGYFGTLWHVMGQRGESRDNRKRTFGHWLGGVYLAWRVRNRGISHIHAHFSVNAATLGLVVARLLKIGYSLTVHNNIFTDRLILRAKLDAAKFIVSISEYSRDFLTEFAPDLVDLHDKIHIVHCGISPDDFKRSQPYVNGAGPAKPHVVSLSSLAHRKGMPVLVEACRILRDRGVDFECTIAGDGPDRQLLETLLDEYALHDVVNMPGRYFQEDIHDYLHRASVFALACLEAPNGDLDGVPVALMEAMAMEVPAVSTAVSGIPELIDDGVSGLLVPERDPEALANAIESVLANHDYAVSLAEGGRQKVVDAFNLDSTSQQLVELFQKYVPNMPIRHLVPRNRGTDVQLT